jgi:hypothetical protein
MIAEPKSDLCRIRSGRAGAAACGTRHFSICCRHCALDLSRQRVQMGGERGEQCSLPREGRLSADQRGLRLLAQGFQVCPVILDHCVSLDSLEPPACKMNSCNRGAASLILWQQQLSIEVFVLWSNSSSQNSGTSSRPTSGARTMRISQFPAEASETDAAGLPSGMHESRT